MSAQLAVALFEAYARNSGSSPDDHFDRSAAEQWMAQALNECGVAELVEALSEFDGMAEPSMPGTPPKLRRLREAFVRVQGGAA